MIGEMLQSGPVKPSDSPIRVSCHVSFAKNHEGFPAETGHYSWFLRRCITMLRIMIIWVSWGRGSDGTTGFGMWQAAAGGLPDLPSDGYG